MFPLCVIIGWWGWAISAGQWHKCWRWYILGIREVVNQVQKVLLVRQYLDNVLSLLLLRIIFEENKLERVVEDWESMGTISHSTGSFFFPHPVTFFDKVKWIYYIVSRRLWEVQKVTKDYTITSLTACVVKPIHSGTIFNFVWVTMGHHFRSH